MTNPRLYHERPTPLADTGCSGVGCDVPSPTRGGVASLEPQAEGHQADRKKHVFEVADSVEPEDAEQPR